MLTDLEEEYFAEEILKLHYDIFKNKLSVIVIAEWYNVEVMKKIQFFDENTRQWWIPETGGANLPAMNELMKSWGIAVTNQVVRGTLDIGGREGIWLLQLGRSHLTYNVKPLHSLNERNRNKDCTRGVL